MPVIRQASFAGGEITPTLRGRSDVEKYGSALALCRNFFISRHGAAISRPGTTYCGNTKSNGYARLIPFIYSDGNAYVLVFTNTCIRVIQNGAYVLSGMSPYEVPGSPPWVAGDVQRLKFAQLGAVLTITHPSYVPYTLTYTNATSWALATLSFDRPAPTFNGSNPYLREPVPGPTSTHPVGKEWRYAITTIEKDSAGVLFESAPYFIDKMGYEYYGPWNSQILYSTGIQIISTGVDGSTGTGTDGGTVGHEYQSLTSTNLNKLLSNTTHWSDLGTPIVTSPHPIHRDSTPNIIVTADDAAVHIDIQQGTGLIAGDPNIYGFRVYKGRGGLMGWIGDMNGTSFTDDGIEPDYSRIAPQGTNPLKVYNAAGSLLRTENPTTVTYFEQRRVLGGTAQRPGTIWGSYVGDYANFDQPQIPTGSSSVRFDLASRRLEQIRAMVGLERLIVFTNSAAWSVGGAGGQAISATSLDAKVQAEVGISWVDPLVIDGAALFVKAKGTGVRELAFDIRSSKFVNQDLTLFADHLLRDLAVVDWAYAEDPWSVVWAVRSDGKLLSLTYLRDQQLVAWAQHDTDGDYEAICSIPEGTEDAVYAVVRRTVNAVDVRFIERQATRLITDDKEAICLDAASQYSGSPVTTISGLGYLAGKDVYALADGNVVGPLTVSAGSIDLPVEASLVTVGLPYTPQLQLLPPVVPKTETRSKLKTVSRVFFEVESSRGLMVGPDFETLTEWEQREVSNSYSDIPLATVLEGELIEGDWTRDGAVVLQQSSPLPVTVLSVTRDVEFGDD